MYFNNFFYNNTTYIPCIKIFFWSLIICFSKIINDMAYMFFLISKIIWKLLSNNVTVYCTIIRTICATLVSNSSLDRRRLSKQLGSSSRFSSGRWCSCWSGRSARGNFPTYGSIWGCAKQVSTTPTYRVKLCSEAPWLPRIYTCVQPYTRARARVIMVSGVHLPGKPRFRKPTVLSRDALR